MNEDLMKRLILSKAFKNAIGLEDENSSDELFKRFRYYENKSR
jgi:hypothetical protein